MSPSIVAAAVDDHDEMEVKSAPVFFLLNVRMTFDIQCFAKTGSGHT